MSQREYYGLFAYFNNVAEWGLGPNNGNSPPFIKVPTSWPNLSDEENRLITPPPYNCSKSSIPFRTSAALKEGQPSFTVGQ